VVSEPGWKEHHAPGFDWRDGDIGRETAKFGARHDHARTGILQDEVGSNRRHIDVVDAAQIIVWMIVGGVIAAGRVDVGPAARDDHRILRDLQILSDAGAGHLDKPDEFREGRTSVQILGGLPVAAARHFRSRRDDMFNLTLELDIQGARIRRGQVHGPKRRRKEVMSFRLQFWVHIFKSQLAHRFA